MAVGGYVQWTTEPVIITEEKIIGAISGQNQVIGKMKGYKRGIEILNGHKPILSAPFIAPKGVIQPFWISFLIPFTFGMTIEGSDYIFHVSLELDEDDDSIGYYLTAEQ